MKTSIFSEPSFPAIGSTITYKGTHRFWFTDIIKDAETLLEVGKQYTVKELKLASSWCGVIVEEFPEKLFALSFFEFDGTLSIEEVRKLSGWNDGRN